MLRSFPLSHSCHSVTGCKLYTCRVAAGAAPPAAAQCRARCPLTRQRAPELAVYRWYTLPRFAPCATQHSVRFSARDYITRCQTRSASPRCTHDQPFCWLHVLALGYGALWPSCHCEPGVMPYSARLTAPDMQLASAAANGGYWPLAARFSAGHGATPRSTLCA